MNNYKNNEHFLINRLDDYIQAFKLHKKPIITNFLPIYQQQLAVNYLRNKIEFDLMPNDNETLSKCICIPKYDDQLISLEGIINNNGQKITQRNVYGALMSLNISKDKLGDVWLDDNKAYITTFKSLKDDIIINLTNLGKATISFKPLDYLVTPSYKYDHKVKTIASFRIDAVVKACANLSRDNAKALISSNFVKNNYKDVNSFNEIVKEGDILSIRGYGRYKIGNDTKSTKANNLLINIYRYL